MRILYISHSNGTDQGALIALRNMVLSMRDAGHTPMVVFPDEGGMKSVLQSSGIPCYCIVFRTARYPRLNHWRTWAENIFHFFAIPYRNMMAEWRLIQLIRSERIDLVHLNSSVVSVGRIAARITKIPYVIHVREMISPQALPWHMFPSNNVFRKRLQSSPHNIAITRAVRDFWRLSEPNTHVIYDGVFDVKKKPEIRLSKKNYFLCVGVINSTKGQLEVLNAFAKIALRYPAYQLWLAGEGNPDNPYFQQFIQQVKYLNLAERVCILGVRDDIYELMQDACAMVASSEREGFGFTIVEAMLCGCPVIGRDAAGIHEQFERGKQMTGEDIGIRYTTVEQLSEQMEKICKNNSTPNIDMLQRAQNFVFSEYSVANHATQINNIYQQIITSL